MQTKKQSAGEALVNVFFGYWINVFAVQLIFPMFGIPVAFKQNLYIGILFTFISLIRSYLLRRLFNKWHSAVKDII